jgi:hypothetical protein
MDMKAHQPREHFEKLLSQTEAKDVDKIKVQILLDIRDLLQEIAQKGSVQKWGPKI